MRTRILAVAGVLATALLLVSGAGAGSRAPKQLDLSTMAKIHQYLRAMGVNPRTVVIQRGARNYAGPRCPGKGWNCTTATRVLQVGSQNTMDCTDNMCDHTIQTGDRNTFRCVWPTTVNPASQHCSVTQTGSSNYALFEQVADQSSNTEPEQDATQIVEVHQLGTGPSPKNELHVFQRVKQSMTTPGAQMQDGHQVVRPAPTFENLQDATGAGDNFEDINQYIDQRASGAATSQKQNTEDLSTTDPTVTDCVSTGLGPIAPNQCVEGSQSTGLGGQNHSQLHQLIDEDAKSSLDAMQTQGDHPNGIDGRIHQTVGGATGSSDSHAHQAMRQNVSGALGSTQVQIDPTSCCGVSQDGGQGDSQNIDGSGSQNSNQNATQNLTLIGQCDTENGSCSVQHHGKNDSANENFSQSCTSGPETPCTFTRETDCSSFASEGGGSTGSCTSGPPEEFSLVGTPFFTATNFLPGVPLSGFEITMGLIEPVTSPLPLR